jgi:hypothetical protein
MAAHPIRRGTASMTTVGIGNLPDYMDLNQELVKQGRCWWYRTYAPGDTVLEGLEKEAREGRKGV